jgi:hypothetical protein
MGISISIPSSTFRPAWVACVAYRKVRQSGQLDQPAWLAARPAIQELRPDLDDHVAGQQASAAIHYASVFHSKWEAVSYTLQTMSTE